ncbi:hypothetical protein FF38_06717 [Lucilia cuprina]|uniref:C-type lectin domain-containing protein n=1 Tax=Lucilia cuprina TaxID=7375 RepID=A0A0L0C0A1_LUCCU|nr:Lectin subunit alpha [Lucilia cuprina]KNC25671.1 hypothetical protein FF38_06717 [Lucilia cuprina]
MHFIKIYQIIVVLIIYQLNCIHSFGNIYITADNKLYYIDENQKYTWFDALSECLKLNMNLVTIETYSKSEEINYLVKETFGKVVVLWVGGIMIRNSDTRNYTWMPIGQQFNYTYWKVNNPDFTNNNEYCVEIGWGSDMEWNDDNCGYKYGFICEQNEVVDLKQNCTQVVENLQEITKSLNALRQEVEDYDQLEENLNINIMKREKLQQELTTKQQQHEELKIELQQIVENELKQRELQAQDIQTDFKEDQQFLQLLQKQKFKLLEILQNRQDLQTNENTESQEKLWNSRKYRDNFFQFIILNR